MEESSGSTNFYEILSWGAKCIWQILTSIKAVNEAIFFPGKSGNFNVHAVLLSASGGTPLNIIRKPN